MAGDITYKNGITNLPANPDEASLEQWLKDNSGADALGLFAAENIVVGNYTEPLWQKSVSRWVNDPRNGSGEDLGEDNLPNTYVGRDGIIGTADDDVLEEDGNWTVEYYTRWHRDNGFLPKGSKVGDAIPGTGEDVDGDGEEDAPTQMKDLSLTPTDLVVNRGRWRGDVPFSPGVLKYSDIARSDIARLDAALYTNHTLAMMSTNKGNMVINGCVAARNMALVYAGKRMTINYDQRLMASNDGSGISLPKGWQPIEILVWGVDDAGGASSLVDSYYLDAQPVER